MAEVKEVSNSFTCQIYNYVLFITIYRFAMEWLPLGKQEHCALMSINLVLALSTSVNPNESCVLPAVSIKRHVPTSRKSKLNCSCNQILLSSFAHMKSTCIPVEVLKHENRRDVHVDHGNESLFT